MTIEKKTFLRTVRLTPTLNKDIELIAEYEQRSIANTIQRLLSKAINVYFNEIGHDFYDLLKANPNATIGELQEMQKQNYDSHLK